MALGLRAGWVWWTDTVVPPLSDPQYYHATASNLADGRGYSVAVDERGFVAGEGSEATAFWAPGYSFALAPLYAAFGAEERWAKAFNAVVGALTVVPVWLLGRRLRPRADSRQQTTEGDDAVGLTAALLFAVCPALILLDAGVVLGGSVYVWGGLHAGCCCVGGERRAWWGWVVVGMVLAATAFVRSQGMVLVVPVMVLVLGPLFASQGKVQTAKDNGF